MNAATKRGSLHTWLLPLLKCVMLQCYLSRKMNTSEAITQQRHLQFRSKRKKRHWRQKMETRLMPPSSSPPQPQSTPLTPKTSSLEWYKGTPIALSSTRRELERTDDVRSYKDHPHLHHCSKIHNTISSNSGSWAKHKTLNFLLHYQKDDEASLGAQETRHDTPLFIIIFRTAFNTISTSHSRSWAHTKRLNLSSTVHQQQDNEAAEATWRERQTAPSYFVIKIAFLITANIAYSCISSPFRPRHGQNQNERRN